jgi:hypothetical protein
MFEGYSSWFGIHRKGLWEPPRLARNGLSNFEQCCPLSKGLVERKLFTIPEIGAI